MVAIATTLVPVIYEKTDRRSVKAILLIFVYISLENKKMETDRRVYEYLSSNLSRKSKDVIDRFAQRIAVFSDFPEMMNMGEIQLKSKLWDYLDEAIEAGITTLYTGLTYGGDSAAAEFFVERKQCNAGIRIVHIQQSSRWISEVDPALRGFVSHTFMKSTDYSKVISGQSAEDSKIRRDHFIIDQCLHIVFITDLSDDSDNSYVWKMLEYATQSHPNSISHQIHIISCSDTKEQHMTGITGEPIQDSLF